MKPLLPAAAASLLLVLTTLPASANLIANGSFEADPVGAEGVPSGDYTLQEGVTATIVDADATSGDNAVRLTATLSDAGKYDALIRKFEPAEARETFEVGETYRVTGSVRLHSGTSAGVRLIEFAAPDYAEPKDEVHVRATAAEPEQMLDGTFVYRGGEVILSLQIDNYEPGVESADATFDTLSIERVGETAPEPG